MKMAGALTSTMVSFLEGSSVCLPSTICCQALSKGAPSLGNRNEIPICSNRSNASFLAFSPSASKALLSQSNSDWSEGGKGEWEDKAFYTSAIGSDKGFLFGRCFHIGDELFKGLLITQGSARPFYRLLSTLPLLPTAQKFWASCSCVFSKATCSCGRSWVISCKV